MCSNKIVNLEEENIKLKMIISCREVASHVLPLSTITLLLHIITVLVTAAAVTVTLVEIIKIVKIFFVFPL